jgi:hypothetical protein
MQIIGWKPEYCKAESGDRRSDLNLGISKMRAQTNVMIHRRTDLQRAEAHVVQIRLFRWGPRERCAKRLPRLETLEQRLR